LPDEQWFEEAQVIRRTGTPVSDFDMDFVINSGMTDGSKIALINGRVYWHLFTEARMAWPINPDNFQDVNDFIRQSLQFGLTVYRFDTGQVW